MPVQPSTRVDAFSRGWRGRYQDVLTAVGMMVTFLFQRENWWARKLLPHTTRSLARARS